MYGRPVVPSESVVGGNGVVEMMLLNDSGVRVSARVCVT